MLDQPIFILGAHKSGTSLLRSIFDGHPNIFAIPIEAHFFQILQYWIDYAFLKKNRPRQLSKKEFIHNATGAIKYSNTEDNPKGDGISANLFDIDSFVTYIEDKLSSAGDPESDLATYFTAYSQAIHFSAYGTELERSKRILEKSVENAELAIDLKQVFPNASFIHILRNPYSNLVSMRKFRMHNKKTENYPWLGYDFRSLYNSCYFLYRNRKLIPNYHVVQYESLVKQPQSVIKELCKNINIEFQNSMLLPTYRGQKWTGNSTFPTQFNEISSSNVERYKSDISSLEICLVNKYMKHVIEDFEYEILTPSASTIFPSRREFFKEYIANRFLLEVG